MSIPKNTIQCPTCQKAGTWTDNNPFKPFCSERCRLIDLGAWASEAHRVPGEAVDPTSLNPHQDDE